MTPAEEHQIDSHLTGLKPRHAEFVRQWLALRNQTEAAKRAGYTGSQQALANAGGRLLRRPEVKAAIDAVRGAAMVSADTLEGKWFVVFGPDSKIEYQGTIRKVFGDICLVQLADWFVGALNVMLLVKTSDICTLPKATRDEGAWLLFGSAEHLKVWAEAHSSLL